MNRIGWAVIVGLVAWIVLAQSCGDKAVGEALGRAAAADSVARVRTAERDSIHRANETLAAAITARDERYAADSVRWQAERAESRARIAEATRMAQTVATDLRARLDSVGARLFAEYEAQVEARDRENVRIILGLETQVRDLTERVAERDELIGGLRAELVAANARGDGFEAANAALRQALRAQGWSQTKWKVVAVIEAAALTYVAVGR